MELYNLSPAAGSTKEAFRKGRGHGSGLSLIHISEPTRH